MKKALVMILPMLMLLATFAPMAQAQTPEIVVADSFFDLTWPAPQNHMWTETSPNPGLTFWILFWTDNGDGKLSASDQVTMYHYGGWYDYHVDWVQDLGGTGWTMQMTYKVSPPVPEFPLGMIMPLAIAVAIGYLGFIKRKTKPLK